MAGGGDSTDRGGSALEDARRLLFLALDPVALLARDYYDVLGLSPDADERRIRAACRELLVFLDASSPPRGSRPEDRERGETVALLIAEIEDCLCDPVRRKSYDAERAAPKT